MMTQVMATGVTTWCANMEGGDLSHRWAEQHHPQGGERGDIRNIRPVGLVSDLSVEFVGGSVNAYANLSGSSVGVAVILV